MTEINTDDTDTIICPHGCGEYDDGEWYCSKCGKIFRLTCDLSVSYTTRKVEP